MPPAAAGHAHVATVSFLASRAAPSAQFWLGLAGGAVYAALAVAATAALLRAPAWRSPSSPPRPRSCSSPGSRPAPSSRRCDSAPRRPPCSRSARRVARLDAGPRIVATLPALPDRLPGVRRRPVPVAGAVIVWAAAEAETFARRPGATTVGDPG